MKRVIAVLIALVLAAPGVVLAQSAPDDSNEVPFGRHGWLVGGALGVSSTSLNGREGGAGTGAALDFQGGYIVKPQLAFVFHGGWGYLGELTWTRGTEHACFCAGVRVWPIKRFWLEGVAGIGGVRYSPDFPTGNGLAVSGAAGVEIATFGDGRKAFDLRVRVLGTSPSGNGPTPSDIEQNLGWAKSVTVQIGFTFYGREKW